MVDERQPIPQVGQVWYHTSFGYKARVDHVMLHSKGPDYSFLYITPERGTKYCCIMDRFLRNFKLVLPAVADPLMPAHDFTPSDVCTHCGLSRGEHS